MLHDIDEDLRVYLPDSLGTEHRYTTNTALVNLQNSKICN